MRQIKSLKKTITVICLVAFSSMLHSQNFTRWDSIPVQVNNLTLKYPWCGGLNNAQIFRIDIDGDGLKDLFTYDKTSLKWRTYINTGGVGMYHFTYAPQYEYRFPGPFSNWVQLFDFNCDGKEDLFTFKNGYIQVWKNNYSPASGLTFSLYESHLPAKFAHNTLSDILISAQTYPAFCDVDNDGDLDLLVYGTEVDYYQNMAVENDHRCDTLDLTYSDKCWGKFSSFGNPTHNTLTFGISCRSNGMPPDTLSAQKHSGQSILAIDLNGDNVKDVLIGDVIQNNITAAYNTGSATSANFTSQDTAFPSYNIPLALFSMNVCHYVDIDNDTVKDLIVSPFQSAVSNDFTSVYYYKNTGTNPHPVFNFQQNNFLQAEMIEVGEGAAPVFFDYNGDGLQDLVVGNFGYFNPSYGNGFQTNLSLYKNTGSATMPQYTLVTRNYCGIDSLGIAGIYPAFGDLDGDGDDDMILGQENGHLLYFNNSAGAGNPCVFKLVSSFYDSIAVGQYSTPQIVDVNRDGKLDLLIGKRNGALSYYQNTGTIINPQFSPTATNSNFGSVYVTKSGFVTGYSVPCLYTVAGKYELVVGSESGHLYQYNNIDGNLSGAFTLTDSSFANIWEGLRAVPNLKDINGDGSPDIGNYSGGLSLYKGDLQLSVQNKLLQQPKLLIWPNPSNGLVNFHCSYTGQPDTLTCGIYNVIGELVHEIKITDNHQDFSFDASSLPQGIYFCKLIINHRTTLVEKLVIEK
jgi:hypothetical protein